MVETRLRSLLHLRVLTCLLEGGRHGYAVRKALQDQAVPREAPIHPGSVYRALQRLTELGLLQARPAPDEPTHRTSVYTLTTAGREALLLHAKHLHRAVCRPVHALADGRSGETG